MRKIIDGMLYDTEKATLVSEGIDINGSETVYITDKGNWFVEVFNTQRLGVSTLHAIDSIQAKRMLEDFPEIYAEYFPLEDA